VWVPSYGAVWGWRNFLQLCDVAVLLTVLGLWRGSALVLSSQAIGSLVINLFWTLDAGARLCLGRHLLGGTEYLWNPAVPLGVRLLSLFHLVLSPLHLVCLRQTGYDRRALGLQATVVAIALVISRVISTPGSNLNFVFRDPLFHRAWGPAPVHLALTYAALVALMLLPVHLALRRLFSPAPADNRR
jgi:hypothetical protein